MNSETNDFSISTLIYLDIFLKIPLLGNTARSKIHFTGGELIPIFDALNF